MDKDTIVVVAVSLFEGFAQAFEQEPERMFTGAQVAESLRIAAERVPEEIKKKVDL